MDSKTDSIDGAFLKPYNHKETEDKLYMLWQESGFFNPENCVAAGVTKADAEPFSMVLPPPNVTGTLHVGHAAMLAIEDIIVRFERMRGKKTLWIPGTDHAAIATQSKVEKLLEKEGLKRKQMGRNAFLDRVNQYAEDSHDTIVNQTKKIGASLDWSREAFSLDDKRTLAVRTAFKRMYDDGLIYRGKRIVNWDPKGQTTISDDEVEYKEQKTPFYYFKYGPFTIGTARPETKFGDKYVVMHPDDKRYASYKHGQTINLEWINGPITATIIKDEAIDQTFGTGVMTITPWHSMVDFEIAQRHKLDMEQIIDLNGRLLDIAGEFSGIKIDEARPKIIEKLKNKGLIEKIDEAYTHNKAFAERSGAAIEPQILQQWFVAVNKQFKQNNSQITLKEMMKSAVSGGRISIMPDHFAKIYFHWIDNLHDWCISRQIWYGHRIPVWYKKSLDGNEETLCSIQDPGSDWIQDEDTLDTWFSSGLWTFSTLGWPEQTEDLKMYHPTSLLETGYDILFFWVARMILMTGYLLSDIPFKNVYLHGLVRDAKGQKMSKSLGNGIDPLEMTEKYGADALRLSLVIGTSPGNDTRISEDKIKGYKHFANKLWNVSRFILTNTANISYESIFSDADKILISEQNNILKQVTQEMSQYKFYLAGDKLYHYLWHNLADIILEDSKKMFFAAQDDKDIGLNDENINSRKLFLLLTLEKMLIALHPFIPFVTEEIWQRSPFKSRGLLMIQKWIV